MALKIRPIPTLTGSDAERFIETAEAAESKPYTEELQMSQEEFNKIMEKGEKNEKRFRC